MMHLYDYNMVRLAGYLDFFDDFLHGRHDMGTATNLLTDVRFAEVAKAFTMKLTRLALLGPIRPLHTDTADILRRCATSAFGTHEHEHLPSWFLQNYEGFLASCTHKLLRHYSRQPAPEDAMRAAYGALIQMAEGMKAFIGLKRVHSGTHALMAACHHSRTNFLAMETEHVCAPYLAFVEQLMGEILKEPNRDMHDRHNSLTFFAKSSRWQHVSKACAPWLGCRDSNLASVHAAIQKAAEPPPPKKPAAEVASLASVFLSSSPSSPPLRTHTRARSAAEFYTPHRVSRHAILKRSRPFVNLVRKLVES